jgi:hypothetical protein
MSALTLGFIGRRRELVSPHSTDEIYRRLVKSVGWPLFSDRKIVGFYHRGGFALRVNIWYGNSFQTILYGVMRSEGTQTRIECNARMRLFVTAFMAVWFLGVCLLGGSIAVVCLGRVLAGEPMEQNLPGILIPLFMLAFGVGLVYFGRGLARKEEAELVAFFEDTIDASSL